MKCPTLAPPLGGPDIQRAKLSLPLLSGNGVNSLSGLSAKRGPVTVKSL